MSFVDGSTKKTVHVGVCSDFGKNNNKSASGESLLLLSNTCKSSMEFSWL